MAGFPGGEGTDSIVIQDQLISEEEGDDGEGEVDEDSRVGACAACARLGLAREDTRPAHGTGMVFICDLGRMNGIGRGVINIQEKRKGK